jgi:hypothetical protein
MRILMTNRFLGERTGTELYIHDVAIALLQRGHTPILYSPNPGPLADVLRHATIPVVDDLSRIAEPPDIIHGHHHMEAMAALLHFPGVPAVYVCHGWRPWHEAPPDFPRIYRYLAVDLSTRDRLILENGIPAGKVLTVPNFVDLDRFRPGPGLPETPRRVLLFSNYATPSGTYLREARDAAARTGMELEAWGKLLGRTTEEPEKLLAGFDVVLAQGRSALEALAVGRAVIVCSSKALGPMVKAADFDRLRDLNFGVKAQTYDLSADGLERELRRYDKLDARAVSARTREEAGLEAAVDRLLACYQEVIEEHRRRGPCSGGAHAETRAAARYLRGLSAEMEKRYALSLELDSVREALAEETRRNEALAGEMDVMRTTGGWKLRESLLRYRPVRWGRDRLRDWLERRNRSRGHDAG